MNPESLNPNPDLVCIEQFLQEEGAIVLALVAVAASAPCPKCRKSSERVHSRYRRVLHDLPWQGVPVRLRLATRRFFCDAPECDCGVFTERFPGITGRSSQRSVRQQNALTLLAYLLGGEAGARAARQLGMPVSPDTLLRLVVNAKGSQRKTPRVLGVDDWAFRKGQSYGTILMDLETGEVVDLLPDRRAETFANWLKEHPGVEEIVRDRAGSYAEGARAGAPDAVHTADRWHLLQNLVDALEKLFQQEYAVCQSAAAPPEAAAETASEETADPPTTETETPRKTAAGPREPTPGTTPEAVSDRPPTRRQQLFAEVKRRYDLGSSRREIAEALGLSRNTVAKYLAMADLPPPASRCPYRSPLRRHESYLRERWQEGQHNALRLWEELQKRGYQGSVSSIRRHVATWREKAGTGKAKRSASWLPSAKQVAWWLLGYPGRSGMPEGYLERLEAQAPRLAAARSLAARFWEIVRKQQAASFAQWLEDTSNCEIGPLVSFAASLKRDLPAVQRALESRWSTGPVEGQNNRLKMIKRTMYGRAGVKLLRARVLSLG
jgi:transposase